MSLENEASLSGTAEIFTEFGKFKPTRRNFTFSLTEKRVNSCSKQHKIEVGRLKEALKSSESSQQNENTQTICGNATEEK